MFAIGLTILPCAWLTDIPMAQAIFAMAGRFFATYAMNTGFQFSVEVDSQEHPVRGDNSFHRSYPPLWGARAWLWSTWCRWSAKLRPLSLSTQWVTSAPTDLLILAMLPYQSSLSEKAPWIIISLIAFVASVPGKQLTDQALQLTAFTQQLVIKAKKKS